MGLAEDIRSSLRSNAEVEAAADEEKVRLANEATQKKLTAQQAALDDQNQSILDEMTKRASLLQRLSPLIDVVQARSQLSQVQEVWTVGEIDHDTQLVDAYSGKDVHSSVLAQWIDPEKFGAILGLRHQYPQAVTTDVQDRGAQDGTGSGSVADLVRTEIGLYVLVGFEQDLPFVASIRRTQLQSNIYLHPRHQGFQYLDGSPNTQYQTDRARITLDDPLSSQHILKDQLLKLATQFPLPLEIASKAREGIDRADLPTELKKQFGSTYKEQPSKPWYQRILG